MKRQLISLVVFGIFLIIDNGMSYEISSNADDLGYYYFPSPSAESRVQVNFNSKQRSLDSSTLKPKTPTVFVIDGFLSNTSAPMSTNLPKTLAAQGDLNVILLDYGKMSGAGTLKSPLEVPLAYAEATQNIDRIAARLAEMINFLNETKEIGFQDVTLIGGSMGAHIAGVTGATVQKNYPRQKIGHIIGLDPAGPLYNIEIQKSKRLNQGQATFVEVYHSNMGILGDIWDSGDINVYVNGGSRQPGCERADISVVPGICSHGFGWETFDRSFREEFKACPCGLLLACTCSFCNGSRCANPIKLGLNIPQNTRGRFYATVPAPKK